MRTRCDRLGVDVDHLARDLRLGHIGEELHGPFGVLGDAVGVDAAFETGARLRAQLETLRRAGDAHPFEERRFEQDLRRGVGDLRRAATHDARDGLRRAGGIADEEILLAERAIHAVERRDVLTSFGQPHEDPPACQASEVEGMERLVPLEQHVVGDVHDVADRTHAGLYEPLRHPRRRRAHRHACDPAQIPGAAVGCVDADRDVGADLRVRGRMGVGDVERETEVSGDLACHAHDAHRVRSVGGDRQVEDHVVQPEQLRHVRTGFRGAVEVDDPLVVVAEAELVGSEEHAVGGDAPDGPAFEDPERLREMRAGRSVRHDVAGGDVPGAAHHSGGVASEVDVDEGQLVGLRMLHDVEHPSRDHPADITAGLLDALDLQPHLVERRDELVGRCFDRRELPDPRQWRAASVPQYCAKKRTSLSKNVRISSMP